MSRAASRCGGPPGRSGRAAPLRAGLFFRFILSMLSGVMTLTRVAYAVDGRTARITLQRPEKRNALDDAMVSELTAACAAAGRDPAVKVVLLGGDGPAFCAGADLDYLRRTASFDVDAHRADAVRLAHLFRTIHELRKPVVARVEGPALAGGCGLATACDFVLACSSHARFGYPEVHIGFLPALVSVFLVKRVGEGRARELILRGDVIDAARAAAIGLITASVPHADLDAACDSLLRELSTRNSGTSMGLSKELLARLDGMSLADGLDFAANMNAAARMTQDCKQGIAAFLDGRDIEW